jgi:3-oxoacyl-[acyl-carrier-protein] synthase III
MKARVQGLGTWLPETVRENTAWTPEFIEKSRARAGDRTLVDIPMDDTDAFRRIAAGYLREEASDPFLGASRRRIAEDGISSSEAEAHAAERALCDAGVAAGDVDVILSWAIVPDRITPSNANRVAGLIGAKSAWAMGVDAACASIVTQLTIAASLIESGRARTVLLTQSHLVTRAFSMDHPASPNVGDGAAAVVVVASERPGILSTVAHTEAEYYDAVTWCRRRSKDHEPTWWAEGGPSYLGSLSPGAAQGLMQDTVRYGVETVQELLRAARCSVDELDVLASVQPRRWVPRAIAEGLGLDPSKAPQTFDEVAHLGAAGVVFNLLAARAEGRLPSGAKVALYAQGAGFIRASALLSW